MHENMYEYLASEIVQTQNFEHASFSDAIVCMDIMIDGKKHYLEYDRLTMYQYNSDLPPDELAWLYSLVKDKLAEKLNADQKKCLYEYWALLWFTKYYKFDYASVKKTNRPDFHIIDESGKAIGIEVTELTTPIDKKIDGALRKYGGKPFDEVHDAILNYLGNVATKLTIEPLGNSFLLLPNEATCLSDQRQYNAARMTEKYNKYHKPVDLTDSFDEFIILGDALRSPLAITYEYEVDEILDELRQGQYKAGTTFAVLFRDHSTGRIGCKGFSAENQSKVAPE